MYWICVEECERRFSCCFVFSVCFSLSLFRTKRNLNDFLVVCSMVCVCVYVCLCVCSPTLCGCSSGHVHQLEPSPFYPVAVLFSFAGPFNTLIYIFLALRLSKSPWEMKRKGMGEMSSGEQCASFMTVKATKKKSRKAKINGIIIFGR